MLRNLLLILFTAMFVTACQKEAWLPVSDTSKGEFSESQSSTSDDFISYKFVERMPYLAECDGPESWSEREVCSDQKLLQFIMQHLRFPQVLDCFSTMVVVSFIIKEDGSISDAQILRSMHPLLDAEVLRVVNMLPPFRPGERFGKPVAVEFSLPLRFHFE